MVGDALWVKPEGTVDGKVLQSMVLKVLKNYIEPLGFNTTKDVQVNICSSQSVQKLYCSRYIYMTSVRQLKSSTHRSCMLCPFLRIGARDVGWHLVSSFAGTVGRRKPAIED